MATSYFNACCTDRLYSLCSYSETEVKHCAIIFITYCSQYLIYTNIFETFLFKKVHAFKKLQK